LGEGSDAGIGLRERIKCAENADMTEHAQGRASAGSGELRDYARSIVRGRCPAVFP